MFSNELLQRKVLPELSSSIKTLFFRPGSKDLAEKSGALTSSLSITKGGVLGVVAYTKSKLYVSEIRIRCQSP